MGRLVGWVLVLVAMAIALVGTLQAAQLAVAAVTAVGVVGFAVVAARDLEIPPVRPRQLAPLWWVPLDLAHDTVRLLGGLRRLGRPGRRWTEVTAVSAADSTVAVLLLSLSPGSYVIDLDLDRDVAEFELHAEAPLGRMDREVLG